MLKWGFAALIALHGLVHFLGAAKGLGLADVPQLTPPISRAAGVGWLAAGVALLATAALVVTSARAWWSVGAAGAILSQAMIATAWGDARFGTVVNVIVLVAAACGLAAHGPWSLRAAYRRGVAARLATRASSAPPLTAADVAHLPAPVRRYVERSGALGQPRPTYMRATWSGRIRGGASEPWMTLEAEQHNFLDAPARLFFMDARRGGVPVDVLHVFAGGAATMRVRVLSVYPMVDACGPELTKAETVTLLNDLVLLAPGALARDDLTWEAIDDRSARVTYMVGANTVSAVLVFDDAGDLVDFVSDDRLASSPDGTTFTRQRWSTPIRSHQTIRGRRTMLRGEGRWHTPSGEYAYIELDLLDLVVD